MIGAARLVALAAAVAALCLLAAACAQPEGGSSVSTPEPGPPALQVPLPRAQVAVRAVRFRVADVNRSEVACAAPGGARSVVGFLVGPASLLSEGRIHAGALLLHGFGQTSAFWLLEQPPGQAYAIEMARLGQVSVVIDRPGYGASLPPIGPPECLGAQADMAHQILDQLRAGSYAAVDGRAVPRFDRLVVTGHSAGGLIAQILGYSFGNADGLMVFSFTDSPVKGPFAPFLVTRASFVTSVAADLAHLSEIRVPVLLTIGTADEIWPPPAGEDQLGRYVSAGVDDVQLFEVPGVGHALVRSPEAAVIQDRALDWLVDHGFSSTPVVRAPSR